VLKVFLNPMVNQSPCNEVPGNCT